MLVGAIACKQLGDWLMLTGAIMYKYVISFDWLVRSLIAHLVNTYFDLDDI